MTAGNGNARAPHASGPTHESIREAVAAVNRSLAAELVCLRTAAGLSQRQLARQMAYSHSSVSAAETARNSQSREFWQRCDAVLCSDGLLITTYDEGQVRVAALREEQARAETAERDTRLAQWRQEHQAASPQAPSAPSVPGAMPSAVYAQPGSTDVHIWFTTTNGVTHRLHVPLERATPEVLAEELGRLLGSAR